MLTALATFPLIFMGGLVTSHGAGMSVPDWPNSYGYNMFTFPPSKWVGGIFYEHTHRLMGTVVGMLSIALTIVAWRVEPRRWVRWRKGLHSVSFCFPPWLWGYECESEPDGKDSECLLGLGISRRLPIDDFGLTFLICSLPQSGGSPPQLHKKRHDCGDQQQKRERRGCRLSSWNSAL
jgi:hypothetical protein